MANITENSLPPILKYMTPNGIIALALYFAFSGILLVQNAILIWPTAVKPITVQVFRKVPATVKDSLSGKMINYELTLPFDTSYMSKEPLNLKFYFWSLKKEESKDIPAKNMTPSKNTAKLQAKEEGISLEMRFILMTLLIGALGSWLHAVSSFVDFVGNRNFISSWVLWYIMRPFIGGVLALIFYMILRAGLLPVNVNGEVPISPYSVAAFAGLAGLFTQRATLKLAEVFDVIFSSATKYKDPLGKKLGLTKLDPANLLVNATELVVKIEGNDFSNPMKVFVNGQERKSDYKGKNLLAVTLAGDDVKQPGKLDILVETSNGERSNALTLDVT
jgi:hypothetical protein